MTIFKTDCLIEDFLKAKQHNFQTQMDCLITPIESYFSNPDSRLIHAQLLNHGLFDPINSKKEMLKNWLVRDYSSIVTKAFNQLKGDWAGPDLDLFPFPIDCINRELTNTDHDISGLSFYDKIFIFFDEFISEKVIKAGLAHEYSHSIRLQEVHHFDQPIRLKDALILEGIAEIITKRLYGISLLPETPIMNSKLTVAIKKWIVPNLEISRTHPLYHHLIYGNSNIPKFLGYYSGTYLVENWLTKYHVDISDLIRIPTEDFFTANKLVNFQ